MYGLRRIILMLTLCAGLAAGGGCGVDDPVESELPGDADVDTGSEGDVADKPDAGSPDAVEPDVTEPDATEPDATEPPDAQQPERARPSAAPGAGGARLETPKHRIRLIVGPRGGAGRVDTSNHRILMGAGSVQHAGN